MSSQDSGQQSAISAFHDDEIVVDLNDRDFVRRELEALGVEVSQSRESQALDLELLRLSGLAAAIDAYGREDLESSMRTAGAGVYRPEDRYTDLDLLLFHLRKRAEERPEYAEHKPVFGKNRFLGGVWGSPHIGGDEIDPVLAGRVSLPQRGEQNPCSKRIGVLDTMTFPHENLDGRYLTAGEALFPRNITGLPSTTAHATFVIGVVAQQAPNAEIIVRSVLDQSGTASAWDVAQEMVAFRDAGVDILNMSFASVTDDDEPPLVLQRAVERLSPDVLLIAAAGNHGSLFQPLRYPKMTAQTPVWPAALPGVVAVGALAEDGKRAAFSPALPWVDRQAPGVGLRSTFLSKGVRIAHRDENGGLNVALIETSFGDPGYAKWSGTSFAAAYYSGQVAALAERECIPVREAHDRFPRPPWQTEEPYTA
ncbi:S8 family serine peptidase [Planobispora siamensis]|uniref:Peptidase S8/S53 domain-containing protein n=1 Tax=Planobispora siamensis TaxID=936338 RepID=A0A8J3SBN6_9ACTN|nr:S8/S53 family peptidase [Planobispora siamensis]GIH89802.1 hypothetical protein Psi01_04320 [Planobispora siamensis]